jgi:hypothetical protein
VVYAAGIVASLWVPWLSLLLYTAVAAIWLVPDRRIEGTLHDGAAAE